MKRPKKHKARQDRPRKYLLQLKYHDTGDGMIYFEASNGTIDFEDKNLASFQGLVSYSRIALGWPSI
jgi:hypothetical protein